MRSDLVFGALKYVPNRFLLTKLAAKAIRELHQPNTRISETANDVLKRFGHANPMAEETQVSRRTAIRIDRSRGVPERSEPDDKTKRVIATEPSQWAETA